MNSGQPPINHVDALDDLEVVMPWVKEHTRGGKRVRSYYRLNSKWNFWFGLILMLLLFAVYRNNR